MKKVKVKLIGKGEEDDPYTVELPTWKMDDVDYNKKECYVLVPDDETKEINGKTVLDQVAIRAKYKENWSDFNKTGVEM